MGLFSSVGRRTVEFFRDLNGNMAFLGETCACALSALVHPRQFRFGDAALAFQRAAFDGLPISIGIGFLLGVILAFQSASALQMFGVEVYVADLLAIGLFRDRPGGALRKRLCRGDRHDEGQRGA